MIKFENNTIVKMLYGSHLYGTSTEDSDTDYKGIYLPSFEEYEFFKDTGRYKCKSINLNTKNSIGKKNTNQDIDHEVFSLHYFIQLAVDGQTIALDMLHAPKSMLINTSEIWSQIVSERHRVYSKSMRAFLYYARNQAAKYGIKGSRLDACKEVIDILSSFPDGTRLKEIWDKLPNNDHQHFIEDSPMGLKQYCVVGKTMQETMRTEYCAGFLKKFYDEFGDRARQAQMDKGVDWKAISHALRACFEVKEIIESGTLKFPLENADFLLQVKRGELSYIKVAEILEQYLEEINSLIDSCDLPDKADKDFWIKFLDNIYKL